MPCGFSAQLNRLELTKLIGNLRRSAAKFKIKINHAVYNSDFY